MAKGLTYFFLFVVFILGLSIGLYTGNEIQKKETIENDSRVAKTVQDIVLRTVQNGDLYGKTLASNGIDNIKNNNNVLNSGEEDTITVSEPEKKVSPYAKITIKKRFTKCNHSTVDTRDIPKEVINLTENELKNKYEGWSIEKFTPDEIVISRDIEANCNDHYVLKNKDGYIAVYNELTENKLNLVEVLNVDVELLADEDKISLEDGIRVYGKENLSSLVEDYNS